MPPVHLCLDQHLSLEFLVEKLEGVEQDFDAAETPGLVVDCRKMPGYDRSARGLFVEWNAAHREQLVGVAVLTHNALYRMVIGAMSLASSQNMKAFEEPSDAEAWLSSLSGSSKN